MSTTSSDRPFVEDALRELMADFRSPFVPDLPRFTGGAVGYLGYGASTWFEPVLVRSATKSDEAPIRPRSWSSIPCWRSTTSATGF